MKVTIKGASNFIHRMYEACGPYQWAREFLKNSIEAKATKVEFGIEWNAVEKFGVYRRTITDNGIGMSSNELKTFFSTLGDGAKKIETIHDNFGVGAKIAALPWNPDGMVVISCKDGTKSMIKIVLDRNTGDYELVEFHTKGETSCVVDPGKVNWPDNDIDWSKVPLKWMNDHGTMIILLGSETNRDTILGGEDQEEKLSGLSHYLNTRFWDLSGALVRVHVIETVNRSLWPKKQNDNSVKPRIVYGAKQGLSRSQSGEGKLSHKGQLLIQKGKVGVDWFLWDGSRARGTGRENGFIALKYKDELFGVTSCKNLFRSFGIIDSKIQKDLTIIIEPKHYVPTNGRWGVHPDQSRNRLIFTGNGQKGVEVPLYDWGQEFSNLMPQEIVEAISKLRQSLQGSVSDESYRLRLQNRFGDRWKSPSFIRDLSLATAPGVITMEPSRPKRGRPLKTKPDPTKIFLEMKEDPKEESPPKPKDLESELAKGNGEDRFRERNISATIPRYEYVDKDQFERSWHFGAWVPNHSKGPTVIINSEAPVILDAIKYHVSQYPPVHAEEVKEAVEQVYGEVLVSKVAHMQSYCKLVAKEEVDDDYRNEKAITFAMQGYLAEDFVVAPRLLKLGRKALLSAVPSTEDRRGMS